MSIATSLRWDSLHHAYLLTGDREKAVGELMKFLQSVREIDIRRSPDFLVERHGILSIDEARKIRATVLRKPLSGRRIYIIAFNRATTEAQHALLKTLEEPTDTVFFLVTPRKEVLIPTVLSRVMYAGDAEREESELPARAFLAASSAERMKLIQPYVSDDEREDARHRAQEFVQSLEREFYNATASARNKADSAAFDTLANMQSYLGDPSSSVKLILEHLSLALPRVSK